MDRGLQLSGVSDLRHEPAQRRAGNPPFGKPRKGIPPSPVPGGYREHGGEEGDGGLPPGRGDRGDAVRRPAQAVQRPGEL